MSIYAFTLAGGNFLAPLICGFIAEYQGWRWVFYYPSIFLAVVFVFLFFALEETNYERHSVGIVEDPSGASSDTEGRNEKDGPQDSTLAASDRDSTGHQQSAYSRKTYLQKLSLFSTRREENTILRRVRQTIYFLSWPVIFYSGLVFPCPSVICQLWCIEATIVNKTQISIWYLHHSFQHSQRNSVDYPIIASV